MACTRPNRAWRSKLGGITFSRSLAIAMDDPVDLPCMACPSCASSHTRQFAIRAMHEAQECSHNCVLTLTYSSAPKSLVYRDFVLFAKRYREFVRQLYSSKIRIAYCGEYGDISGRPHFHALVFGHDFDDKFFWRQSASGSNLYRSSCLESLWTLGHCEIGELDISSAMYVCGYAAKKFANRGVDLYSRVCPLSGEVFEVAPEKFQTPRGEMGGLGVPYLARYYDEILSDGLVVVDGKPEPCPKFYLSKLSQYILWSAEVDDLKCRTIDKSRKFFKDGVMSRLRVKEEVIRRRRQFFNPIGRSL